MGKSWLQRERPDHQFNQSRTNACTPMTHLFLETRTSDCVVASDNLTLMNVVRSGQPVTLINLSFFEPETIYRCFNELFLLLTIPALDHLFRNPSSGHLKKNWIFVVDNGPSEAPASSMIRMLLVRFVNFLGLDKAIQISFEKLNSKDNPAERPHASENFALSRHGPFTSAELFPNKNAVTGSKEHRENMEEMAKEVIICLRMAKFGGHQFFSFRGIKDDEFIFKDEDLLRNFLRLSEQGKDECFHSYKAEDCQLFFKIQEIWNLTEYFEGTYIEDYNHTMNSMLDDKRTAWLTTYMAAIYTKDESSTVSRTEREPLPDFMRWLTTTELHYMSFEDRSDIETGDWDKEAHYMPSRIIEHVIAFSFDPPDSVIPLLALLAWLTPDQLTQEIQRQKTKMEKSLKDDQNRDKWKNHELYKMTIAQLIKLCGEENIPIWDQATKLELVEAIARHRCFR